MSNIINDIEGFTSYSKFKENCKDECYKKGLDTFDIYSVESQLKFCKYYIEACEIQKNRQNQNYVEDKHLKSIFEQTISNTLKSGNAIEILAGLQIYYDNFYNQCIDGLIILPHEENDVPPYYFALQSNIDVAKKYNIVDKDFGLNSAVELMDKKMESCSYGVQDFKRIALAIDQKNDALNYTAVTDEELNSENGSFTNDIAKFGNDFMNDLVK